MWLLKNFIRSVLVLTRRSPGSEDVGVNSPERSRFLQRAAVVGLYAIAMAYLEAAVVVYLQRALSISPLALFPLRDSNSLGGLGAIEVGRELATLVMLATVGWLAGRKGIEPLAWVAVAFGIWDLGYYAWLWVFIGWPTGLGTYDLLFLFPVPWVAPVWAPMVVSLALVFFGLLVVRRSETIHVRLNHMGLLIIGGLVVIVSFTVDAKVILNGGIPSAFAWPLFVGGMAIALWGGLGLSRST
jgi:hypothetical protein